MPISIGDAVLTFLGDTTQLDVALTRINNQAKSQLSPAAAEAQKLSGSINAAGQSANAAAQEFDAESEATAALKAQIAALDAEVAALKLQLDQLSPALEKTSFSMAEAKETAGLLTEAVGVKLPRGVRGFLAELPGVGAALEGAFSAVAVYFLIDAVVQATEKLTQFISDTFIYTEEMKKADAITSKMNTDLLQHSDALKKLKDDYSLLGLQGVARTSEQIALLNKQITENAAAIKQVQSAALGGDAQSQSEFNVRASQAKEFQQQLVNLEKEAAQERLAVTTQTALANIDIEKQTADSIARFKAAENKSLVDDTATANVQLLQIDSQLQIDLYNNQLIALQRKRAIDLQDPTRNKDLIAKDNHDIEDLQRDHATALEKIYASVFQGINALDTTGVGGRGNLTDQILGTDFQDKFQQAEEAATTLGVTLTGSLAENVDKARIAFDQLKESGVGSTADIYQSEIKLLQLQIQLAQQSGQGFGALVQQLLSVQSAYDKLTGTISRTQRQSHDFWQQIQVDQRNGVNAARSLTSTLGDAFNSLTAGIESAIAASILGQKSLGAALRESVSQALAAYAAQEAVKAIIYTAEGFAALAAFDYGSAANFFTAAAFAGGAAAAAGTAAHFLAPKQDSTSSSSSSTGGSVTTVSQPAQNPVQTTNLVHLYGGGVVSRRTAAVLGDSAAGGNQREAVVPLGQDDNSLNEIADRLYARQQGGQHRGVTINVYPKGNLVDMHDVVKEINSGVNTGKYRLTSSNALRLNKRG